MRSQNLEQVADGVWLLRGGVPPVMNVYLLEELDGITLFDAGIKQMTKAIRSAVAELGRLKRVVLGHAHVDHRGAAPGLDAPVFCHADERADAAGDGGLHYFDQSKLEVPARFYMPLLLRYWDGGPVALAGTLREDEEVAGFRVVHTPGHAPGHIVLFRESDRLALTSDCFYTLDPVTGVKGPPRLPREAFNWDEEQTREAVLKLAALDPAAAWPGHADPLVGDVADQLKAVAEAG